MKWLLIAILTSLISSGGSTSWAGADNIPEKETPRQRLETLAMWKMMESLNLDKATADKIFEVRHKFLGKRKELRKSLDEDFNRLNAALRDEGAKDKELSTILDGIRLKRRQIISLHDEQYDDVSKILTVRQRAELVLFLKEFQKQIRGLLRTNRSSSQDEGLGHSRKNKPARDVFNSQSGSEE